MLKTIETLRFVIITALFFSLIILNSCYYDNEEELYKNVQSVNCDTTNVTYSATIAPIMQQNCVICHSATSPGGGYALDSYAGISSAVANGINSRFWGSINHLSGYSAMPKGGNKLSVCDLKKTEIWLIAGHPNN